MIAAIENGITVLTQNLNNFAAAVNATNANFNHLTAVINQGPAAGGGGGGAWGEGGGGEPDGGVSVGLFPFALIPGCTDDDLVIDDCEKRGSSLYNAGKEAVATEFDISHKKTVIFESEMKSKACMIGWDSTTQGILTFTNNNGQVINIIKEYDKITKNKLLTEYDVFINGVKANQQAIQNKAMWTECIEA